MSVMDEKILAGEAIEMTKSKQSMAEDNKEIDWASKILERFHKAAAVAQQARDINKSNNIPDDIANQYINYEKPGIQKSYEIFLEQVINHEGNWNTVKSLRASRQLSKSFQSEYEDVNYPRVELRRIIRIKTKRSEDKVYRCIWLVGLTNTGQELGKWVDDCDLERIPRFQTELLQPRITMGQVQYQEPGYSQTQVAKVWNNDNTYRSVEIAPTTYLVDFSEKTVREWLKDPGRNLDFKDSENGISLVIKKEGENRSFSIKDLNQFLNPSFDSLYESVSSPPKTYTDEDMKRFGAYFRGESADKDRKSKDSGDPYR